MAPLSSRPRHRPRVGDGVAPTTLTADTPA